ncbi:Uncharacterized protein APZ42_026706 [Daphnia magna]|uniref:Uncharacterized protein n=1 Tax=Daphnia magna TaxID=35525 RepID=A0A0P5X7M0_9CRUS|nr:Uncharacterized protein APZ42_026706 [Daphnia magna]
MYRGYIKKKDSKPSKRYTESIREGLLHPSIIKFQRYPPFHWLVYATLTIVSSKYVNNGRGQLMMDGTVRFRWLPKFQTRKVKNNRQLPIILSYSRTLDLKESREKEREETNVLSRK